MALAGELVGAHPVMGAVSAARELLSGVSGRRLWSLSDTQVGDTVDAVAALKAQAAELELRLIAEAHGRDVAGRAAACSTQTWLRGRTRVTPAAAKGQVVLAAALTAEEVEPTRQALAAGRIGVGHARVITEVLADLPDDELPAADVAGAGGEGARVRELAQAQLIAWAERCDPVQLATLGRRIEEHVAPEISEGREAKRLAELEKRAYRRRELRFTPDGHGIVHLRGRLDTESAAIVRRALDPLAKPRPTDPDTPDSRSPAARNADALVELSRRALTAGDLPTQRGELPQLVITIGAEQLARGTAPGQLDNGDRLSPRAVRRIGCDAAITRAVVDQYGVPLALGRTQRLFSPGQRRASILRDGGCAFPGCDRPPHWTQAHHITHWIDGGTTDVDNGVLLCGYHHRVIHKGHWRVRMAPDKRPEFVPPEYVDSRQQPIRNHYRFPMRQ